MLGGIFSFSTAGALTELFGRKWIMFLSGLLFVASAPIIGLSHGYWLLLVGRLFHGLSGGFACVAVPLYLAECLPAESRGKGTALFQLLLTAGLVAAALIGLGAAKYVEGVQSGLAQLTDEAARNARLFDTKDTAWRLMFWVSAVPALVFSASVLALSESPRWLFRRGRKEAARAALLRSRSAAMADLEIREMEETACAAAGGRVAEGTPPAGSLLSRKYVVPFVLVCFIAGCQCFTGINAILQFLVNILNEAGLPGSVANWADVILKIVNCLATVVAMFLVDRMGRKFLLTLGSGGIVVTLAMTGILFLSAQRQCVDCKAFFQSRLGGGDKAVVTFDAATFAAATAGTPVAGTLARGRPAQLTLVYAYGPYPNVQTRRTDERPSPPIVIERGTTVPKSRFEGWLTNPFASYHEGQTAPLVIKRAMIGPAPGAVRGWLIAACLVAYTALFAIGPGICIWLALTELMPTRIRANGMSVIFFFCNVAVTAQAAVFLPVVASHGYAAMFFFWAGCTVLYPIVTAFFMPETKGKTLEEIEEHFSRRGKR
jgi:MFS family permease